MCTLLCTHKTPRLRGAGGGGGGVVVEKPSGVGFRTLSL